jgi:hypothetical protein
MDRLGAGETSAFSQAILTERKGLFSSAIIQQ